MCSTYTPGWTRAYSLALDLTVRDVQREKLPSRDHPIVRLQQLAHGTLVHDSSIRELALRREPPPHALWTTGVGHPPAQRSLTFVTPTS